MVAVVTGGAKGIGRQIVTKLVAAGYKVAFCYLSSEDDALALCRQLNGEENLRCIAVKCDVRSGQEVKQFVDTVISVFGGIDVVINNAGIADYTLLMDLSDKDWRNIMSTNLDSVFYMCKHTVPHMLAKGGSIINISSIWGVYGGSSEVAYSASKAGVIGLTKALAQEVGSAGIRVNCIAPGAINTDMNSCHSAEVLKDIAENTPLGRIGEPEDVADLAVFLAGEKSKFIIGQVIEVSGGLK